MFYTGELVLANPGELRTPENINIEEIYNVAAGEIIDRADSLQANVDYELAINKEAGERIYRQVEPTDLTSEQLWLITNSAIAMSEHSGLSGDSTTKYAVYQGDDKKIIARVIQENVMFMQYKKDGKTVSCIAHVDTRTPMEAKDIEYKVPEIATLVETKPITQYFDTGISETKEMGSISAARTFVTICPDGEHEVSIQEYIPGNPIQTHDNKYYIGTDYPFVAREDRNPLLPINEDQYWKIINEIKQRVGEVAEKHGYHTNDKLSQDEFKPANIIILPWSQGFTYPSELSFTFKIDGRPFVALPIDIPAIKL
jgi:hypothetical protein